MNSVWKELCQNSDECWLIIHEQVGLLIAPNLLFLLLDFM